MRELSPGRREVSGSERLEAARSEPARSQAPGKATEAARGHGVLGTAVQRQAAGGPRAAGGDGGAGAGGTAIGGEAPRMGDWQMDGGLMAAMGISGASSALPHGEAIQRSFGKHDVGGIQAHVGGAAAEATAAMGAEAYATGSHVAFAGAPSLHTAAHEAAHVIQQRGGVQPPRATSAACAPSLKGGVGEEGDPHERHADAVADAVVAGRSAEPLLDAYGPAVGASSGGASSSGGVQLKPVKEKGGGERNFQDDKHPKLRLVKEEGSAAHEYRIKDRIQKVYWKDDSNYFSDVELNQPLDLQQFEATREFGAFLETFQGASVLENDEDEGSEAASMHLLQQFFANALFNTQEIERFDYQASPLNYQVEHSYIRAAATSNVEVFKDQLLEGQGFELEKVYLASQMDFRDTLHQMFRAIAIDAAPSADSLQAPLDPLAEGIAAHVAVRFVKKTEFEAETETEKTRVSEELRTLNKEILNLEGSVKGQKRDKLVEAADLELFDWIKDKEEYVKTHKEVATLPGKREDLKAKIAELEKQTPSTGGPPQPSTGGPPQPGTGGPPQPSTGGKPGAKAGGKPKASPLDGLKIALAKLSGTGKEEALARLATKLGVDATALTGDTGEVSGNLEAAQLTRAKGTDTDYGRKFGRIEVLRQQLEPKRAELEAITKRSFELMRDFDKSFGGLAFVDFTVALAALPLGDVPKSLTAWGELATRVLLAKIEAKLPSKKLSSDDVTKVMAELKKAKVLSKTFFSGGMVEVENKGKRLSSPALVLENNTLAMPVKTALGKSGYVPTPTSVNRKLVQSGVSLKDIVLGIIDKQRARQPIDEDTKKKLGDLRAAIAAFDPDQHEGPSASGQLGATRMAYKQFCTLASHEQEHVGLLVQPVIQLFGNLRILDGDSPFPPFALRQLETHLQDAVADAADITALQRSVQNLHEFVVYALELSPEEPAATGTLDLPDGAQEAHLTQYGLTAFSHTFEGVMKQHRANGGGELHIAALNNIYFEMMQKLGYTQGASRGGIELAKPSSPTEFLKNLKPTSLSVKIPAVDLVVIDIHPNDAAKEHIHQQEVADLLHQLFGDADPTFRCTVMVDVTLNHITEDEIVHIRNEGRPYIAAGQLNLVFNQSLTKFAQFGTDKHSGGLMFHYNDGTHWEAFNEHVKRCAEQDSVDPTIRKYFMALFEHTEKENVAYLQKVRLNSRYVYAKLQEQLATISCQEVLSLAENDDPKTCYVAFNYNAFAAKLLGADADEGQVRQLAHDILFECINAMAGALELPLNMRTSFGFPISNLGDIDPGIRLTVGIESPELLDRYVQLMTFANGAIGREFDSHGAAKLADPGARQLFLREITASITTLEALDGQIKALQGGKGAAQTSVPTPAPKSPIKPKTSTSLQGEKIDVGIGSVQHIQNSCYIASLLNLFAASPAYRTLIEQNRPPAPVDGAMPVVPTRIQTLCQRLHAAIATLRTPGSQVTGETIREIRDSLHALGWLAAPDVVEPKDGAKKGTDPSSSTATTPVTKAKPGSDDVVTTQQDAAEILQKFLGELVVPAAMSVGEQNRKKQDEDVAFTDLQAMSREALIQLPISGREVTTLQAALKQYCAVEDVEDFGLKLVTFKAMPRTLTIALKRFDFDGYGSRKNYRKIEVPQEFTMPNECLHPDLNGRVFTYRVVSFVEHAGGYGGGHYIAHARQPDGSGYKNDDLQDGTRRESADELGESLARSYLYVFEQVGDAL